MNSCLLNNEWWLLRPTVRILSILRLKMTLLSLGLKEKKSRWTFSRRMVKICQFSCLTANFWPFLRQPVDPVEILKNLCLATNIWMLNNNSIVNYNVNVKKAHCMEKNTFNKRKLNKFITPSYKWKDQIEYKTRQIEYCLVLLAVDLFQIYHFWVKIPQFFFLTMTRAGRPVCMNLTDWQLGPPFFEGRNSWVYFFHPIFTLHIT